MALGPSEAQLGNDRIAVTVIGGYLGSGKTTLVNHLLREATERIVVLVNDFGDINIDADLIQSRDEDTIELANGCICCSLIDGFAGALDKIVAMDPRPDRLVIEASGVSDPAQVAAYGHGPGLTMDAVVVLVDAETIHERLTDAYVGQTVAQQLNAANILVLNKADLISPDQLAERLAWAAERCPEAFVATARQARVAPEILFGRSAPIQPGDELATNGEPGGQGHEFDHDLDHEFDHEFGHDLDHGTERFKTWTIERDQPMSRTEAEQLIAELPETVVRAKGFVWLEGSDDKPAVLQLVGRRWTLRRLGEWPSSPATNIVVIEVGQEPS